MRDKDLILRSGATNLTTSEAAVWKEVYGLPTDGIDLYIHVPAMAAGADTLIITVLDGTGTVGSPTAVDTIHTFKTITGAAPTDVLHARLSGYRRLVGIAFATTGSSPNFGKVKAWLSAGPFKTAGE